MGGKIKTILLSSLDQLFYLSSSPLNPGYFRLYLMKGIILISNMAKKPQP